MRGPGEQPGEKGRRGVHKAKIWLEGSTRIQYCWTAYDSTPVVKLLTFTCPGTGRSASFDIGGVLRGEELENKSFLAEVKDYGSNSNQYAEFKKFLALCYIAYTADPSHYNRFIWITWRPFGCDNWDNLTTVAEVIEAVVSDRERVFGPDVKLEDARKQINTVAAAVVAERLWLIILSEGNESLVITKHHKAEIARLIDLEVKSF